MFPINLVSFDGFMLYSWFIKSCVKAVRYGPIIPDVEARTLIRLIDKRVRLSSVSCFWHLEGLCRYRVRGYIHRLAECSKGETDKKGNHINGLGGFWGYLKRRLVVNGGIRGEQMLLEYVW